MIRQMDKDELPYPSFEAPTRTLIVVGAFYRDIADHLIMGAQDVLAKAGVTYEVLEVPGALEIPTAITLAARSGDFDGYVALGCVIRGETTHYETVCNDSSRGLMMLGLKGICIGNGILTVENVHQAMMRARPDEMNKGGGAAIACLHLIQAARKYTPKRSPLPEGGIRMAGDVDGGDIA